MNKVHPYRVMEREYVSGDMSLRELCRQHDISAHSVVVDQAKNGTSLFGIIYEGAAPVTLEAVEPTAE